MMKKITAIFLALVMTVGFVSCSTQGAGNAATDTETTAEEQVKIIDIVLSDGNGAAYSVIFPEYYHMKEGILCWDVYNAIGAGNAPTDDWMRAGDTEDPDSLQILLGDTNRASTAKAAEKLRHPKDYLIMADGNKIAVYSEDPESFDEAIKYFLSCISEKDGKKVLSIPETCYHSFDYPFASMTVGGKSIYDFSIVIPDGAQNEAAKAAQINEWFLENIGECLPVKNASDPETECEILLGNTGRAESLAVAEGLDKTGFIFELKGTKLVAAYNGTGTRAVSKFMATLGTEMTLDSFRMIDTASDYEIFRYDNFAAGRLSDELLDSVNPGVLALLSECMYFEYKLQEAIAKGDKWVYSSSEAYVKQTGGFDEMVASGKWGGSCCMPQAWTQIDIGVVPLGIHLYGNTSGEMSNFSTLGKYLGAVSDFTGWNSSATFGELYKAGEVKPGDIFFCTAHTFIYLGDGLFMAAGHDSKWHSDPTANTNDSRHCVFDSWIRPINDCGNWNYSICYQQRYKDEFVPKYYRNADGDLVENPMYSADVDIQYKKGESPETAKVKYRVFKG